MEGNKRLNDVLEVQKARSAMQTRRCHPTEEGAGGLLAD